MGVAAAPLLLLDLDGVVVFEAEKHGSRELIVLHEELGKKLVEAKQETVVVTHRSRREAEQILRAANLKPGHFLKLLAAEDVFRAALRGGDYLRVLRKGLLKSFALPVVEKLTGRPREDIVLLDDKQHNLSAMLEDGAGLAIKATFDISDDHTSFVTFDTDHMLECLPHWHANRSKRQQIDLPTIEKEVLDWRRSGLSTESLGTHPFNRARRLVYSLRKVVSGG